MSSGPPASRAAAPADGATPSGQPARRRRSVRTAYDVAITTSYSGAPASSPAAVAASRAATLADGETPSGQPRRRRSGRAAYDVAITTSYRGAPASSPAAVAASRAATPADGETPSGQPAGRRRSGRAAYDVAIAGAGPAGSAAAIALARGGARVAIHDRGDARAIGESLVPSARTLLAELGVLDRFLADGHAPCYGNLSAWGSSELAEQDFIRSPYGHGWHLDRPRFDAMLRDAARDAGVAFVDALPAAPMTIDATGRASAIARTRGVRRIAHDRLIAFFAVFRSERNTDQDSRTLVESAPEGWFHTARLPNATRVVTFFTDEGPPRLPIASTDHVMRVLSNHEYEQASPIQSRDARSARLERFHGDDWLAVGDAALSFDPLSSQGILAAL